MNSVKAEVTFMVYGQNGTGKIQKRTLELENQDFIACTSSSRDKNENLNSWCKTLFPTAQKVKIQGATRVKEEIQKKEKAPRKSVFKGNILFLPFRIIGRIFRIIIKA